jgi:hypothetical protein
LIDAEEVDLDGLQHAGSWPRANHVLGRELADPREGSTAPEPRAGWR